MPLYQTTSYVFRDSEHAADLFALRAFGNIYTRLMNPTTDVLEKRLAAIHGGTGAVALASGSAAIFYAIATLTSAGQNFVTGDKLYGGTYTQFRFPLKRFGIEARFVDSSDPANFERAIDENTRLLYTESIGNPKGNVDDFEAIADIAHKHGLPFIVDNTVTPPPLFNPFEHGADIVVYSLTKLIGGHGTSLGGAIVEKGDFDWKTGGKFPEITEPDAAYHGVNFWDAFGATTRRSLRASRTCSRSARACCATWARPSRRSTRGCSSRASRPCRCAPASTAPTLWRSRSTSSRTRRSPGWTTPALPGHPDYERAKRYLPLGPGAVLGFGIKGGLEAGKKFINSVKLASHLANVLDAKTLVIHPASTTHQQLTPEEQLGRRRDPRLGARVGRPRGRQRHHRRPRPGARSAPSKSERHPVSARKG